MKKVKKGKCIVIKKNGKSHFAFQCTDKDYLVRQPYSFDVEEKELKDLSNDEKKALKEKKQKKQKVKK